MTTYVHYWLDSGANIHSCVKGSISLDDLGFTEEEWESLSEELKDDIIRPLAWDTADWGYRLSGEEDE